MGMMDWMDGDDDEADTVATDGLGFDEDLDDLDGEMGDLDGGMGDLDGGMDDLDDEMGDLDGEMGGFDDGDSLGGSEVDAERIAEIEDRLSEMENEVSSLSSGMNTVREENKQIGDTVEELDDTIRKLLDIYEMVTRGINPFVDDAREMGGLDGDGAFGLFEMEEETEEDLDTDIASADAEEFFDEDFGELDADPDEAEMAAEDELAEAERDDPAAALEDAEEGDGDSSETDSGGGSSFEDLKAEYEENEGWDGEGAEAESEGDEAAATTEEATDADAVAADEGALEDAFEDNDAVEEIEPDETLFERDEAVQPAGEVEASEETAPQATDETQEHVSSDPAEQATSPETAPTTASSPATGTEPTSDSDAYLTALPARYTAESVVLEWTRFLVDVGGAIGAARALRQYRSQGWITRQVERTMSEHVRNAATAGETERPQDLRVEHHRESLTYVSRLAGDVDEARLLEELSELGGGSRGIRR
ncbi:flagella accessory protein C [Halobellus sp. GM3]|uniref:flagella accessory protein C n=1 Tax=Halobellus sp. GM3 TaxID=3458410 RepID=UPI00403D969F